MLRRKRRQSTHLLRAGQRTQVFKSETSASFVRFRAMTLKGDPDGRVDLETGDPSSPKAEVRELAAENLFEDQDVLSISVVPVHDTAITFAGPEEKGSFFYLFIGFLFVIGATAWTALEFIGG